MKPSRIEAHLLVLVTLGLVAFGLVMVYSATSAAAAVGNHDPAYYLKRQAAYAIVGVIGMIVASRASYSSLRRLGPTLVAASLVLLLGVLAVGASVNGARRWISFGPAAFQPSELVKLALAVWAAAYLAKHRSPQSLGELARPVGALVGLVCLLLLAEPDLGTAIAVVLMVAGMLLIAGTPVRVLAGGMTIATAVGLAAIWLEPYRRARIFSFVNPWHDAQGAGFQVVQAMIGMGSGGLFGVGLGQGVQKVFYLPEAHSDMIFAIIGEELGLVGSAALIFAYAAFAYAGLRIALTCRDPFGKRLAGGLTVLVAGQAAINLAAVMGLAPLTGITLPLVSSGGSSLVVSLVSVGMLLNIAWNGAEATAVVPDRGRRDGRPRAAGARGRGRASRPQRVGDVRRLPRTHGGSARP